MKFDMDTYGPLAQLEGKWMGDKGMDIAPDPGGIEENPYFETIVFEPAGTAKNADRQILAAMRYHQSVTRKSDRIIFHDEVGYWYFNKQENSIMLSLTIPRAVSVLAGGTWQSTGKEQVILEVATKFGDSDFGILESPFMKKNAHSIEFSRKYILSHNLLEYEQNTSVDIYGRRVDHTDRNLLTRHDV